MGYNHPKLLFQDLGVATFFILSGFLVTLSVVSKPHGYSFADYLIDRGARIFVPYVPAIVFIVLMGLLFKLSGPIDPLTILGNLLMLEDYPLYRWISWFPEVQRVGSGRPLWSVAMEWWFYMAVATFYFAGRLPLWSMLLIIPGLVVFSLNMLFSSLALVWLAGALMVLVLPRMDRSLPWWGIAIMLAVLAGVRLVVVQGNFYELQFGALVALVFVTGLKAAERWNGLMMVGGVAKFIAAYSYTLYLTHYTVMSIISDQVLDGWPRVVVVFLVANVVAIGMWTLFERHHRHVAGWLHRQWNAGSGRWKVAANPERKS